MPTTKKSKSKKTTTRKISAAVRKRLRNHKIKESARLERLYLHMRSLPIRGENYFGPANFDGSEAFNVRRERNANGKLFLAFHRGNGEPFGIWPRPNGMVNYGAINQPHERGTKYAIPATHRSTFLKYLRRVVNGGNGTYKRVIYIGH